MSSAFQVVFDACVLVNEALRDTLLRLAEPPSSLYLPRWSAQIIDETRRTLETKLGRDPGSVARLIRELEIHFGDAWVRGYEALTPVMTNDPKDRHILAAAVHCGAATVVTFSLRDFPESALKPWLVEAQSPDAFPIHQFHLCPEAVLATLGQQAAVHAGWEHLMKIHERSVPRLAALVRTAERGGG